MKRILSILALMALLISPPALAQQDSASACTPLPADDAARTNIELAIERISGLYLPYGAQFSFNETVGPRNARYGYQGALNGRGVKVTGGGAAQVASALWLAVKNLDNIAIVQKSTYGSRYNQSYVDSSNDAILTDYSNGTDFSFRNIGDTAITISTWVLDDTLYCVIYNG